MTAHCRDAFLFGSLFLGGIGAWMGTRLFGSWALGAFELGVVPLSAVVLLLSGLVSSRLAWVWPFALFGGQVFGMLTLQFLSPRLERAMVPVSPEVFLLLAFVGLIPSYLGAAFGISTRRFIRHMRNRSL